MIKAQSLEATLPTIIFIHDVYILLLEQDHKEKAGVQKPYNIYKMYKNATNTIYKNDVQIFVIKYLLSLPSSKRLRLEVLYVLRKIEYKLSRKNYLQTNAFSNLVVVEQEDYLHALQKKITKRAMSKLVKETTGWTQSGLTIETSTSASTKPFWWQSYIAADVLQ